ncbi:MAG: serine hydrolase [Oligoflexia bacterium]|nr:serine hydrolase [Oligoflexia bacterium]
MSILSFLVIFSYSAFSFTGKKEIQFLEKNFCQKIPNVSSSIFSKSFLHEPGIDAAKEMLTGLTERFGKCKKVKEGNEGVYFEFAEARVPFRFRWSDNKIEGFEFGSASYPNDSLDKVEKDLDLMKGEYSYYSFKNGKKKFAARESEKKAVGRSGEIFLLSALEKLIANKKAKLSDSIAIQEADRIESSGILVDWPIGTFVSIDSLRYFMIVQNDAMASDLLFRFIGKSALKELAKKPLSNKEYEDVIRLPLDKFMKEVGADKEQKRLLESDWRRTKFLGWQFSAEEMCKEVIARKADPIFSVATSPLEPKDSEKTLYIGSWQEGISHGTVAWLTKQGWNCVSLIYNGPEPIDVEGFHEAHQRLMDLSQ